MSDHRCKWIILSIHAEIEYVSAALGAGIQGYLLKESASDEIPSAIASVLRGERFLGEGVSTAPPRELPSPEAAALERLTPREVEVLGLIGEGLASEEIAQRLFISIHTVQTHRKALLLKLELHRTVDLVRFALRHGLVTTQ